MKNKSNDSWQYYHGAEIMLFSFLTGTPFFLGFILMGTWLDSKILVDVATVIAWTFLVGAPLWGFILGSFAGSPGVIRRRK